MSPLMRFGFSLAALCAGLTANACLAQDATRGDRGKPDEAASTDGVADIVVTATRRETSLQRTPASIAVVDGALQRDRGQQRLEDLQLSVPNVSFTNTSNSSQLYVRGVGNTFINSGGDPGVAFYQDGAYVSDQRTTNTSMFDIARVEVLRGPQGALYGRNAVGGALNVISARPTAQLKGQIDVVAGDRGRFESEGFVSGSLASNLEGRLSYQVRRYDGYTRNLLAGRNGAPDRFDDLSTQAVRGQLAVHLPGGGKLNLLASYFDEDDAGPALNVMPVPGIIYPVEALYGVRPGNDPRLTSATVGFNRLSVATFNANWVQPIGRTTLTVIANRRDGDQRFLSDCDGTAVEACRYSTATVSKDNYAEAYLSSDASGALRWTIGGTYGRLNQDQRITVPWQSLLAYFNPSAPTNVPFPITYDAGGKLKVESYAVYADARLRLTSTFALAGQIRYSHTTKTADEFQTIPEFGVNVPSYVNRLVNHHLPFKVGVEAQLTPDILLYGNYATANKDGAINIGALQTRPVEKETVRSWEAGWKTNLFDRRVQFNGAVFTSRYENLQITQIIQTVATLANAPRSGITGGELELVVQPVGGLRMAASLGYLDAKFDRFSNSRTIPGLSPGPVENLKGNRLPYVPEFSTTFDTSYSFGVGDLDARLGAQVSYRTRIYFDEFNDRDNSAPPGAVVNLDASIGRKDRGWQAYGYLRNLFNRTYPVGSTIYSGLLGAERAFGFAPPRTFALGLRYRF